MAADGAARPRCVVHLDLDGARHIFRVHGWRHRDTADALFESALPAALALFAELQIPVTFFAIAEDLDDASKLALLRAIVEAGHEIASHTTTHRFLTRLSEQEQRREIDGSRRRLSDTLGVEVRGFRAPAFDLDDTVLRLVGECGYIWDSSLFVGRDIGPDGERLSSGPQRLGALTSELVELPLPGHAPLPLPFHPSYSFVLGHWYFRLGLGRYLRSGAPLVLLFHLTEFAEPLQGRDLPNLKSRLFTLSHLSQSGKLRRCRRVFDEIGDKYKIVATEDLLQEARF